MNDYKGMSKEDAIKKVTKDMNATIGSAHFGWCKHSIGLVTIDGTEFGRCSQVDTDFSFHICANCRSYDRRFSEVSGCRPRVRLHYMVNLDELKELAYVENPIWVKILLPTAIKFDGLLGRSERELAAAGLSFCFEKDIAKELINMGLAEEVK